VLSCCEKNAFFLFLCLHSYFVLIKLHDKVHLNAFDLYRCSDEVDKLPQSKTQLQKFSVHQVHAVIERMNEDSDEELSSRLASLQHSALPKGNESVAAGSEHVEAAVTDSGVKQPDQMKRKLRSSGHSNKYREVDSGDEQDDDVESDDSADFFKQLTTKLKTIVTDREIPDSETDDREPLRRRSRLSLEKTGANKSSQEGIDSADIPEGRVGAKNLQSSQRLTQAGDKDRLMPVKQKSTATQWLGMAARQQMEDWDHIESLSDSDTDGPLSVKSKPSDMQVVCNGSKSVDAETPNHTSSVAGANKRKQILAHQLVRPSSRPGMMLKYCPRNELLDAADEITVEEDDSDVADEDFLSLASGSPATLSEKGHTPSKKLTGSFWLNSPESRKSAHLTDDEFVSNSALGTFVCGYAVVFLLSVQQFLIFKHNNKFVSGLKMN